MNVEFVDTNVLVYAHDHKAGLKQVQARDLLAQLIREGRGALSIQVLTEFYWTATKKLHIESAEAEQIVNDYGNWSVYRSQHRDLLQAAQLQRRYKISWWDALIVTSAIESGCSVLWTEDLKHGQRFGSLTVRNPFRVT
jgi:predicted nucleic acid-binding protein